MPGQRIFRVLLTILLVLGLGPGSMVHRSQAASPEGRWGPGLINADDPCAHIPDPPGKAEGIHKRCATGGGSSGISKGDFNGDGIADLAIGEPGATIGGSAGAGDVIILYGSASGITTSGRELWYEGRIPGTGTPGAGDGFGSALASGDFNGDGFSDLAIGIPGKSVTFQNTTYTGWGRVVVLYGSSTGLTTSDSSVPRPQVFDLSQHFTLRDGHAAAGAGLGQALAWGDFNGDGAGDLAIGAPNYTLDEGLLAFLLGQQKTEAGAVWILFGIKKSATTLGGLTLVSNLLFQEDDLSATFSLSTCGTGFLQNFTSQSGDHFGAPLASGDFDGDTHSDLAIAAPDKQLGFGLPGNSGQVYVLPGTPVGLDLHANYVAGGSSEAGIEFGEALAAGDFNGDGKSDLAMGAPRAILDSTSNTPVNTGGSVTVAYGSPSGLAGSASCQVWSQQAIGIKPGPDEDRFGAALAAGDFNGDGRSDLAVGVPGRIIAGLAEAGEVDVIYGSSTGLSSLVRAPQSWNQANALPAGNAGAGNLFGSSLTAWNFGRNELIGTYPLLLVRQTADLAIGVPFQNVNGIREAGAVDVMYGSVLSNGLTGLNSSGQTANQVVSADSIGLAGQAGAHFGQALY